MRESAFRKALSRKLKDHGYFVASIETGGTVLGFPDLIMIKHGFVIFLELKVGKNKPSAVQRNWAKLCAEAGGLCYTITRGTKGSEVFYRIEASYMEGLPSIAKSLDEVVALLAEWTTHPQIGRL